MSTANPARKTASVPFQLVARHPVLDFVNTLDWRFRSTGPEELIRGYDDLLRFTEQCRLLGPSEARQIRVTAQPRVCRRVLASARRFREMLAAVLYSVVDNRPPAQISLERLSSQFHDAQDARILHWKEGRLIWAWHRRHAPEFPLWKLAIDAAALLASEQSAKIRACCNPECRWLFLDTSRNHSRRWCDMKLCGNRIKARRFRRKQ
jgi:predicted RNA-binding Zn ribbon-like protein